MKTRPITGTNPFEIREEDVQKCAYFLWKELGCPSGRDLDLWLTARELLTYSAAARGRAARKNCARMAKMRGAAPRVFG